MDSNEISPSTTDTASGRDAERKELIRQLKKIERLTLQFFAALLIAILVYSLAAQANSSGLTTWPAWLAVSRALAILLFVLAAAAVAGGFLGFLFGLPRQMRQPSPTPAPHPAGAPAGGSSQALTPGKGGDTTSTPGAAATTPGAPVGAIYRNNTNLEEISDWVTKIIVGLSLVEADNISKEVASAAARFKESALPGATGADVVFVLLLLAGAVAGFLFFYLETRTRITLLFVTTETAVDGQPALKMKKAIEAVSSAPIVDMTGRGDRPGRAAGAPPISEDKVLLRTPYDQLKRPEELAAWASAQARKGNLQPAILALNDAIAKQPDNKDLVLKLADVQALQGSWQSSYNLLSEASDGLKDDPGVLRRELLSSLYLGPPDSFQRALPASERLLKLTQGAQDPFVQLWTAAAQGQRYSWLPPGDSQRPVAREAALQAVKRVIELSPDPTAPVRVLLREIFDPAREHSSPEENDLEVFRDDVDFEALIHPR